MDDSKQTIKKPYIPIFLRFQGFNIAFLSILLLGVLEEFFNFFPNGDTEIFFLLMGFGAGSFYTQIYNDAKIEEKKLDEKLWKAMNKKP